MRFSKITIQEQLMIACERNDVQEVKYILKKFKNININYQKRFSKTCITEATINGNLEIIQELINTNQKIDFSNLVNPIYYAIEYKQFVIFEKFIPLLKEQNKTINLHLIDIDFLTDSKFIEYILNNDSLIDVNTNFSVLFRTSICVGNLMIAKLFFSKITNNDINEINEKKKTILHLICDPCQTPLIIDKKRIEIVEFLCEHKYLKINFEDQDGNTALHLASLFGLTNIVLILLQHNANVLIKNKNEKYAIHYSGNHQIENILKMPDWNQLEKFIWKSKKQSQYFSKFPSDIINLILHYSSPNYYITTPLKMNVYSISQYKKRKRE